MKSTTLLIMAAGLGSRYGGNKQIDGLGPNGECLMQYSIYDALQAGFRHLVFVIKPEHQPTVERLCRNLSDVSLDFVYQDFSTIPSFYTVPSERVKPFGTVHAVLCAAEVIHTPFAVINADDFYGFDAFRTMHDNLLTLNAHEAAAVAYYLKNTVSRNGSVTRGICRVEQSRLKKVTETYQITVNEQGQIQDADCGILDGNALVSMNLWGFLPSVFKDMKASFNDFLKRTDPHDIKSEYALPTMVDAMIGAQALDVRVLTTESTWFGVTYREDRDMVAASLRALHEKGVYPTSLF